jgi:hypothetical protein
VTAPNRAERRAWPKRRHWLSRVAADKRLTAGAKSWLLLVASRSDDAGKPCWGRQTVMAAELGRSRHSVIRYVAEGEALGYVKCFRSTPQRDPATGRWYRRKANAYYLCLPPKSAADQPAPRRRQRAPFCPIGSRPHRLSLLRSTKAASTLAGAPTGAAPPANFFRDAPKDEHHWSGAMSETVLNAIAEAKAALFAARGSRAPRHPTSLPS